MMCATVALLFLTGAPQAAPVQASPTPNAAKLTAYDVVSIRQNKSGSWNSSVRLPLNGLTMTNVSAMQLILLAFGPKDPRSISGLPDWTSWTSSTKFDVEAKMDDDAVTAFKKLPPEEIAQDRKQMVLQLLIDRFRFKMHHEMKELPVYALVVPKGGSKLKETDPSLLKNIGSSGYHPGASTRRDGEWSDPAISMDRLANRLSAMVDREVLDRTGLTGKYYITLKWLPVRTSQDNEGTDLDASRASIFTAVQEQLGLKLESTKAMTDTIVVDHIEMPSDN